MVIQTGALLVLLHVLSTVEGKVPVGKTPPETPTAEAQADTARASGTPGAPVLGPLIPALAVSRIDSLAWWPPAFGSMLAERGLYVYRQGWAGQPNIVSGLMMPGIVGALWFGFPVRWQQELGGEFGSPLPASADGIGVSYLMPMLGTGNSTVLLRPWLNEIISPRTRFEVLGGPLNDRYYAFSFGTGIASSLSSLFSVALRSGGGARTNSDYSTKQYDWRVDLDPPLLGTCRIFTHYSSTERGLPGVDPRLWAETYSAQNELDPNFWALQRGYGAIDAMWMDDRETIETRMLTLQTMFTLRERLPVNAALFTERVSIDRRQSIPLLQPDSLRTVADGPCETNRNGLLTRITLAQSGAESLWIALSYEKTAREATLAFARADSTWDGTFTESESAAQAGVGIDVGMLSGSVTATDADQGLRFSGGGEFRKEIGGVACLVGVSVSETWRGLDDIWRWRTQNTAEPLLSKGVFGVGWASLHAERGLFSAHSGIVAGHAWDAWGWCAPDSLPPGRSILWGPSDLSVFGTILGGSLVLSEGLAVDLRGSWLPWRGNDEPVPLWPDLRLHAKVRITKSFGTAAVAHMTGIVRHIGRGYTGPGKQLPTDPVWSLDGRAEIEIGDFTILCVLDNLTGERYEEVRGYPIEGLHLQLGFHWLFWD